LKSQKRPKAIQASQIGSLQQGAQFGCGLSAYADKRGKSDSFIELL
jgi:hypothetical protein